MVSVDMSCAIEYAVILHIIHLYFSREENRPPHPISKEELLSPHSFRCRLYHSGVPVDGAGESPEPVSGRGMRWI